MTKLFQFCLMLLACAIALSLAVELLTDIWPWIFGLIVVALAVWLSVRWVATRNRRW